MWPNNIQKSREKSIQNEKRERGKRKTKKRETHKQKIDRHLFSWHFEERPVPAYFFIFLKTRKRVKTPNQRVQERDLRLGTGTRRQCRAQSLHNFCWGFVHCLSLNKSPVDINNTSLSLHSIFQHIVKYAQPAAAIYHNHRGGGQSLSRRPSFHLHSVLFLKYLAGISTSFGIAIVIDEPHLSVMSRVLSMSFSMNNWMIVVACKSKLTSSTFFS